MDVTNPTLGLIGDVLGFVDPAAQLRWRSDDACAERVAVNGVAAPVVRLPWREVESFFDLLFDEANRRFFRERLPRCRRTWNRRFRRLAGRIDCARRHMELSSAHFEACGAGALAVVVVHEMVHLSLYVDRRPYGHTPEFKSRSYRLGLPGIYHDLPLPERIERSRRVYLYRCRCGAALESRVRFRTPRACAECCRRYGDGRYDERFRFEYVGLQRTG